jgi:serine/threonine protein kinase
MSRADKYKIGDRIDKYVIRANVGSGGFGTVYRAYDPDLKVDVAIKVLDQPDELKRFQSEVHTLARLDHKNIVKIYASGEEAGNPYLVMQFLEGQNLREVIKQSQSIGLLNKVYIITQMAEGLAYAHSQGVVHRDVKPENIMLLPDDTVKILDFGIALALNRSKSITVATSMVLTPLYAAPEQFSKGLKGNEQTDIYSFGTVCYELLTGIHPFAQYNDTEWAFQKAVINIEPRPLDELVPGCPGALETLVHETLVKKPEFRSQKFEEVQERSEAILTDLKHEQAEAIRLEVRVLMESGDFLNLDDLKTLRDKIRRASKLDPGNRELRRVRDEIDQGIRQIEVKKQVSRLLVEAQKKMNARQYTEAIQDLETADQLDPKNTTIMTSLQAARARWEAFVSAKGKMFEANVLLQRGARPQAQKLLKQVLDLDPENSEAKRLIQQVGEESHRDAIQQEIAGKRWTKAEEALQKARTELPGTTAFDDLAEQVKAGLSYEEGWAKLDARVRKNLANDNLSQAEENLKSDDTVIIYRNDRRWKALKDEIARRSAANCKALELQAEIADVAGVRERLDREIQKLRSPNLAEPELMYPIAEVWDALRKAFARLYQAQAKYQSEGPWDSLEAELRERENGLETEIADIVRSCPSQDLLGWYASQLATERDRYPDEPFWGVLQTVVNARREFLEGASIAEFGASPTELQPEALKTAAAVACGASTQTEDRSAGAIEVERSEVRPHWEPKVDGARGPEVITKAPEDPKQASAELSGTARKGLKWLLVAGVSCVIAAAAFWAFVYLPRPIPVQVEPDALEFTYPGPILSKPLKVIGGRRTLEVRNSYPWLIATAERNTTPATVNVKVDPTGLIGNQSGKLTIIAGKDASETKVVSVKLTDKRKEKIISAPPPPPSPTITAIPPVITFPSYRIGGPTPSPWPISIASANPPTGLRFSITRPPSCSWLNLPASGTTPSRLNATVNTSGLQANTPYTCTFTINAPNAAPANVSASLTVNPPPPTKEPPPQPTTLSASPLSLAFGTLTVGGTLPPPKQIKVESTNPVSLAFAAEPDGGCPWLTLSPNSRQTPATLNVSVNGAGLVAKDYSCTIRFASNTALAANPAPVTATLKVIQKPLEPNNCKPPSDPRTFGPYGSITWSGDLPNGETLKISEGGFDPPGKDATGAKDVPWGVNMSVDQLPRDVTPSFTPNNCQLILLNKTGKDIPYLKFRWNQRQR